MARYSSGNMSICVLLVVFFITSHLYSEVEGFKYHDFCATPPQDMKTRFPLYSLEVDTKTNGIPWAYRQNNTITVSVKAMYLKYKIRQIFISVPAMTAGSPEVPAKRIHRGEWKWDMRGGVIPIDCTNPAGGFTGGGSNAVRNFWWIKDGFYNVTAEWDPLNTISNAYNVDIIQFEVYVSPDREEPEMPAGTFGPAPAPSRWVKLTSEEFINLDYIDLHRYIRSVYGPYMDPLRSTFGVDTEV